MTKHEVILECVSKGVKFEGFESFMKNKSYSIDVDGNEDYNYSDVSKYISKRMVFESDMIKRNYKFLSDWRRTEIDENVKEWLLIKMKFIDNKIGQNHSSEHGGMYKPKRFNK